MKNEKVFKLLDVIVKVANLVATFAQIISQTFKSQEQQALVSQEDAHIVRDFMSEGLK